MKSATTKLNPDLAFRAFSDRTRLRILHLLLDGELCVGDLVQVLENPAANRFPTFGVPAQSKTRGYQKTRSLDILHIGPRDHRSA